MRKIDDETIIAYDQYGQIVKAERLQKWAYNQLAVAPKLLEVCKLVLESLQQTYETAFDVGDIPATNFLKPNIGLLDKTISEAEK